MALRRAYHPRMFDINSGELLIIALVALIVFGPQRLPELLKRAGAFIREMRAMGAELQRGLERDLAELKEPIQEIKDDLTQPVRELKEDLTKPVEDLQESVDSAKQSVDESVSGLEWTGPVPESGPTPDQAMEDLSRIEAGENLLEEAEE